MSRESARPRLALALVGLAAAVLLAVGVRFAAGPGRAASAVDPPAAAVPAAPEAAALRDATAEPPAPRAALVVAAQDAPDSPPPPAAEPARESPAADLAALDTLALRVVDPEGFPVRDAQVRLGGLRRADDLGSWYAYRGAPPGGTTDAEGYVTLEHWRWVASGGRTARVDLAVEHPDFASYHDTSFEVGPGVHTVVLQRGSMVVVSVWTAEAVPRPDALTIRCDRNCRIGQSAWARQADGRYATRRVPPGPHLLWVEAAGERGPLLSEIAAFELAEGGYVELEVQLFAGERLLGELDRRIPRPIVDGRVMLSIQRGGLAEDEPPLYRTFEADVDADGTFELADLPRGRGQLFALCRGWCVERQLAESAREVGSFYSDPYTPEREREAILRAGDRAWICPWITLPQRVTPLVVTMERTATVEALVRRPDGTPVDGASVAVSAHVNLVGVGNVMAPGRAWEALSDAGGAVRFEDVPRTTRLHVIAEKEGLRLRTEGGRKSVWIEAPAGEVTTVELVLEPER